MNTERHVLFIRADWNLAFTMCGRHPCHVMTKNRHTQNKKTALKYSPSRGLLTGYSAPTPWYTSTTQHVCALIFVSLSTTYVHSNSQLLPNYPHNTCGRQCADWEKTSHNLAWYRECIQKNVRKNTLSNLNVRIRNRNNKVHCTFSWILYSSVSKRQLPHKQNWRYRYAPHNDVSANDGPHIRRWSHKIMILHYNIII